MGRPVEYNEEILKKAKKYIASCKDKDKEVNIPTLEGLALYLKIHRDTIYAWRDDHEEFSDIVAEVMGEQGKRLINNGLAGKYNPTIAKLLLSKHGYKEQIGLSGEGEGEPVKLEVDVNNTLDKVYGKSNTAS